MQINALKPVGFQPVVQSPTQTPNEVSKSFANYLSDAIGQVNQAQVDSETLNSKYVAGQVEDVHQVMIASQKASLSLQLTMQVRNKVIESYQEIMRMPI
ncbi:flagellar hook-basal body complex protein FliE [Brevibacillus ginsengisoli]|uniref:flagellar hook-basal body complex protein FliE n=1 Tax=Brevibacillus ginsengisoli TaxID=363854 RepID=UPI003CEFB832